MCGASGETRTLKGLSTFSLAYKASAFPIWLRWHFTHFQYIPTYIHGQFFYYYNEPKTISTLYHKFYGKNYHWQYLPKVCDALFYWLPYPNIVYMYPERPLYTVNYL